LVETANQLRRLVEQFKINAATRAHDGEESSRSMAARG